jgi:hypothetical protein
LRSFPGRLKILENGEQLPSLVKKKGEAIIRCDFLKGFTVLFDFFLFEKFTVFTRAWGQLFSVFRYVV